MSYRLRTSLLALLLCAAWASAAAAEVTLGVFTPAAKFASIKERIMLGESLAAQLRGALGADRVRTRVYARSTDFEAAVNEGTIALALVDASYLAFAKIASSATVIVAAPRVQWRVLADKSYTSMSELRGKRLILANGGSEVLLAQGLFGGEASLFFASILSAQDSASAIAALTLRKADAALVPMTSNQKLPANAVSLLELEAQFGVVLVAFPSVSEPVRQRIAKAIAIFRSTDDDGPVELLSVPAIDVLDEVRARLKVPKREAPMPTLSLRALIDALVAAPLLAIPQRPAADFALTPSQAAAPPAPPPTPAVPAQPAAPAPTPRR